jgi:hypothetical protein
MPNWIEGSLKLRGKSENLKRFFENAILPCANHDNKDTFIRCYFTDTDCQVDINPDAYIDDTTRAFVSDAAYLYWNTSEEITVLCIPIKQAWGFETDEWLNIANKYDIDIRLYGVESGMGFWQEIEIGCMEYGKKREVIKNLTSRYSNYDEFLWECPIPLLGG